MVALTVLSCVIGYLLGSVLPAEWLARRRGVDIRTIGDGNPGTVNAFRGLGAGAGTITLLYDASVGVLSIALARALGVPESAAYLAGLSALVGHRFPVFSGFRGGQGMACSAGMLLYGVGVGVSSGWLDGAGIGAAILAGVATLVLTRSDRAVALTLLPVLLIALALARPDWPYLAFMSAVAANIWVVQLVEVRHRVRSLALPPLRH